MDEALAKKLQIEPGRTARVFAAPKEVAPALGGMARAGWGPFDVVLVLAKDRAALAKHASAAIAALGEPGILWTAYPKKSSKVASDLDRDHGWEPLTGAGLDPVSQVAIDETWSALRWKRDPALRAARVARGSVLAGGAKKAPAKKR